MKKAEGKEVREMASIQVVYQCGCGFRTTLLEEAVKHSDLKNHTLTVLGTIQKEENLRASLPPQNELRNQVRLEITYGPNF